MVREAAQWEREEMEKVVRDVSRSRICSPAALPRPSPDSAGLSLPRRRCCGGFGSSLSVVNAGLAQLLLPLRTSPCAFVVLVHSLQPPLPAAAPLARDPRV